LARREKLLIAQETENATNHAERARAAAQVAADGQASRTRTIEQANAEMERARMAIYRELPSVVLLGLAARELASKLSSIEHVNVTPDLLAMVLSELGKGTKQG